MKHSKSGADVGSLEGVPFFSCLSPAEVREIERYCRVHEFGTDEKIIQQGEEYTDVYILVIGKAHVLNYSETGRAISYATLSEGDIFGELAAIDDLPRSAWVWTMTPCTVVAMPGSVFRDLVTSHPDLSLALLRKLAGIIRIGDERIVDVGLLGAEQRVCIELIRMAAPDPAKPKGLIISPFPTHATIADVIGLTRETVSRVLSRLRQERIIRRKDETLYILKRKKLERRALF